LTLLVTVSLKKLEKALTSSRMSRSIWKAPTLMVAGVKVNVMPEKATKDGRLPP